MKIKQIMDQITCIMCSCKDQLVIVGVSSEFRSYRGYYSELCVAPSVGREMGICEFFNVLADQIGKTFTGYKGGDYTMTEDTELYVAYYGDTGEKIVGIEKDGNTLSFITEEEAW